MLLASTQKQMESSAQAHQELARKIRVELELPLDNFILEQKDKRKLVCKEGVKVILHYTNPWIHSIRPMLIRRIVTRTCMHLT